MTPEQTLWQSVVLQAVTDATYAGHDRDLLREMAIADRWLRDCGRYMRQACYLAGLDPEFVSDAYAGSRIDRDLLRCSEKLLAEKAVVA